MGANTKNVTADVGKLAGGAIVAQLVGILVSPILSRVYGPEIFGMTAVFSLGVEVFLAICCLRYQIAIVVVKEEEEAIQLCYLSFLIAIALSLVTLLFYYSGGHTLIVSYTSIGELAPFLKWWPLVFALSGLISVFSSMLTRAAAFGRITMIRIIGVLTVSGVQLLFTVPILFQSGGLIIGRLSGILVTFLVFSLVLCKTKTFPIVEKPDWQKIKRLAKEHRKFPLLSSPAIVLSILSWHLPTVLLGTFFGPAIAGLYFMTTRLLNLPIQIFGQSVGQVFIQRLGASKDDKIEHPQLVEKFYGLLFKLGAFPIISLIFIAPELFSMFLGEDWIRSGKFAQILAMWLLVAFVASPLSNYFSATGRQGTELAMHSTIFVTRMTSLIVGGFMNSPILAVSLYAISGFLVYGGIVVGVARSSSLGVVKIFETTLRLIPIPALAVGMLAVFCYYVTHPIYVISFATILAAAYSIVIVRNDDDLREIFLKRFR